MITSCNLTLGGMDFVVALGNALRRGVCSESGSWSIIGGGDVRVTMAASNSEWSRARSARADSEMGLRKVNGSALYQRLNPSPDFLSPRFPRIPTYSKSGSLHPNFDTAYTRLPSGYYWGSYKKFNERWRRTEHGRKERSG